MESSSSCGAKEEEVEVGGYNSNTMKKARLHSTLTALLEDPILADVPKKPTLSDVDTLISLEMGSAMRISILKLDGTSFGSLKLLLFSARHLNKHFIRISYKAEYYFIFFAAVIVIHSFIHLFFSKDVAVMNSATVKDLKLAIKKKVNDMEQSNLGHRHISWQVFIAPSIQSWQLSN